MSECLKCFYYHPDCEYGYDYCGYHDKELDTLDRCDNFKINWSDKVKELEQQLKEADYTINSLIHHFHRYGMDEESLVILMEVEKARNYLTKYEIKE